MTAPTTRVPAVWPAPVPTFHGAGLTHTGTVREKNEDSILTDPTGVLWAVADGMGGYGHGSLASDIVIEHLSHVSEDALAMPALRSKLHEANHEIYVRSTQPDMGPMGATVVAMMIQNSVAHIAWAGDCRAYMLRRGQLRLLTKDHTVVQDLMDQGVLHLQDGDNHPERHVVTRAIGAEATVDVDAIGVPVVSGDRLLLCSDGLTACLGDLAISDHLGRKADAEQVCKSLVTSALQQGAPDNISVICIFAEAR